jgi:MoaA/NifB/PqqE/SkfB family radical SAM enzyme
MNLPTTPARAANVPAQKTCGQCEYFDAQFGDCRSRDSDRFQTAPHRSACAAFYPDTTAQKKASC